MRSQFLQPFEQSGCKHYTTWRRSVAIVFSRESKAPFRDLTAQPLIFSFSGFIT